MPPTKAPTRNAPNSPIRRVAAEALSDAEVQALGTIGAGMMPSMPGDGSDLALTEAETLILEAKGATIQVADNEGRFNTENPNSIEDGTTLFKIGSGEAQFTGTLMHSSGNDERVYLWHPETGVKRALVRAHLFYYIAKGWLPRPPFEVEPATIKCVAKMGKKCTKVFSNLLDCDDHFRKTHQSEARHVEGIRARGRQDRLDGILEKLAETQGLAGQDNGTTMNMQVAGILATLVESVNELRRGMPAETTAHSDAAEVAAGKAT